MPTLLLTAAKLAAGTGACREQFAQLLTQASQAMGEALLSGQPLPVVAQALLHDPALRHTMAATEAAVLAMTLPPMIVFAVLGAAYHIGSEASGWQGSLGKRLNGLRVVDQAGRPLKLVHATGRYLAGAASWATLNLGHLLVTLPPQHRALHDRLAGTQVLARHPGPLSKGARAWLWLQAALAVAASAWLATRAAAMAQAALENSLL